MESVQRMDRGGINETTPAVLKSNPQILGAILLTSSVTPVCLPFVGPYQHAAGTSSVEIIAAQN